MKYSEFKAEVEKLGFSVKFMKNNVYVEHNCEILGNVDLRARYMLATQHNTFFRLDETVAFKLYEICMMLAETPPEEREEEKRYLLEYQEPPILKDSGRDKLYLYKRTQDNYYNVSDDKKSTNAYQTIFTESEIAEMDITGFKKEPVE